MKLVAFTGVARAGKDEAGRALIADGFVRHCFGDIIKGQLDPFVRQHLGFSAFTENDVQKRQIRTLLESWGDANYDNIMAEYFATLPERAVNTRLVRTREAAEWRARGGFIYEIRRPHVSPATQWESLALQDLWMAELVDGVIENNGSPEDLHAKVRRAVGI
jgi:hypothetical protein